MSRVAIGELGIKDMYEFYKEYTPSPVSFKLYKEVVNEYLQEILNLIIDEGHNYRIPGMLGYFRIQKKMMDFDIQKMSVDWKASKEVGKRVYHLNNHSDGYRIKFLWEKKKAILKKDSKRPYSFTLARDVKRRLASVMKKPNGHTKYPEEFINIKD